MKKKKDQFNTLGDSSAASAPESKEDTLSSYDQEPLFFEPVEDDFKKFPDDGKASRKHPPRPSLRFRVKSVNANGEILSRLPRPADRPKAVPKAEKKKKKKKKEKLSPEKAPLEEIFSPKAQEPMPPQEDRPDEGAPPKMRVLDYVRYAMLFVCFSVFLYSSYTLVDSLASRAQSRAEYDQLSDSFHKESPFAALRSPAALPNASSVDLLSAYIGVQPEEYLPTVKDQSAQSKIDMVNFLKNNKNKDTLGWMIVPGTNIDYPVVHTKDNDYYLRRSYYGKSNLAGTLFADYRNTKQLMNNRNTVIYGHNMNDGSMFNNLHDLAKENVFQNCTIELATPNGIFIYQVFSVHEALDTSEFFQTDFESDSHFSSWLQEMQAESRYKKEGLVLSPGDRILTLSTCMDPVIQSEYRWAVHAKLVEIINYTP